MMILLGDAKKNRTALSFLSYNKIYHKCSYPTRRKTSHLRGMNYLKWTTWEDRTEANSGSEVVFRLAPADVLVPDE